MPRLNLCSAPLKISSTEWKNLKRVSYLFLVPFLAFLLSCFLAFFLSFPWLFLNVFRPRSCSLLVFGKEGSLRRKNSIRGSILSNEVVAEGTFSSHPKEGISINSSSRWFNHANPDPSVYLKLKKKTLTCTTTSINVWEHMLAIPDPFGPLLWKMTWFSLVPLI